MVVLVLIAGMPGRYVHDPELRARFKPCIIDVI